MSEVRHFGPRPRAHDMRTDSLLSSLLVLPTSCGHFVRYVFRAGCKHSKPLGLILQGPTYHGEGW